MTFDTFDTFDPETLQRVEQSKLMNGLVVPRPIAWVSTIGAAGANLAPFSYFNVVAVQPCMVMFSVSVPVEPRRGTVKDTLQNLTEVPEFVLHLVDRELAEKMSQSSAELPRGHDEFAFAGLAAMASTRVRPPRIAEAGVHMECRVHRIIELGEIPYHMVIGEVFAVHVRAGVVNARHHVDQAQHAPVARLGSRGTYTASTDRFQIKPPEGG